MTFSIATPAFGRRRRPRAAWTLASLAAGGVLAAALALWLPAAVASGREQGAAALRASIVDAAAQCAAVEGAYPASLDHLVERYGIRFDGRVYDVRYEAFAGNVEPAVAVSCR